MASQLRVNKSENRSGLGTITYTDTGAIVSGIVTANSFSGSISGGTVAGSTGTFSSTVSVNSGNLDINDSIRHIGDTNTKIRFPSADTFTVETAGDERLRITSAGSVGIGTNNPSYELHVRPPAATSSGQICAESNGVNTFAELILKTDGGSANIWRNSSQKTDYGGANSLNIYQGASANIAFFTAGNNERLRITSGGKVNIGGNYTQTNAPLCVTTSANDYGIRLQTGSNVVMELLNNDAAGNCEIRGYYNNNSGTRGEGFRLEANGETYFNPGGNTGLCIKADGKVGIGENNPGSSLVVEGTIIANNGTLQVDKHIVDGTDDWAGASYILHNKKAFTNGTWTNYFKFDRSDTAADNNDVGVFAGHLHIVYLNDRSNSVHTTGYDVFPFIIRGRSNATVSGTFGSAVVDLHEVIGSSVDVRFNGATADVIYIQIKIYNSDAGGSERLCHAWIDGGGVANLSNRFLFPETA